MDLWPCIITPILTVIVNAAYDCGAFSVARINAQKAETQATVRRV